MPYSGKVALITGAASGMGQLSTWRLAAEGVSVAAIDVNEAGLARTTQRAPMIRSFLCDVSDNDAVQQVVKEVEAELGPIDRVVNAAAIAPTGRLLDQSVERIQRVMEINYGGLVNVTKAALPGMIERRRGDLIQYGSLAGWLPSPHFGAYSATKAAVVSFSETLFHECAGSGVRFVCVCPPVVDTPLLDQVQGDDGPPGFDKVARIQPEQVLDAVEAALDRGELLAFPGRGTATLYRLRRYAPGLIWNLIDRAQRGT
jgi:NAD(P)-dependent dehydrogenase (short-subunit alcohol dehydrogenase family)